LSYSANADDCSEITLASVTGKQKPSKLEMATTSYLGKYRMELKAFCWLISFMQLQLVSQSLLLTTNAIQSLI